jgi:hypothetical protein
MKIVILELEGIKIKGNSKISAYSFKRICLIFRMLINRMTNAKMKLEATAVAKHIFQFGDRNRELQ